jgi:UDP-glucuronate 4-epimerase
VMPDEPIYLVTGAMGCLGAWTLRHLVREGKKAVSFDLSGNRSRLDLLLNSKEQAQIRFVKGNLADFGDVLGVIEGHNINRIVHLAALQVPFCRSDPVLGAQVNVVGTVNLFEAARQANLKHITYASSIAVYGPTDNYSTGQIAADSSFDPRTLYGVYKQANEGTAQIFWQDHGVSSIALRPYTVYGVTRDQGVTSEPTKAMLYAASGRDSTIGFGGNMQFDYASDVARRFIEAADTPTDGAYGFALGSAPVSVAELGMLIERERPGVTVHVADTLLPFPHGVSSGNLSEVLPLTKDTPLKKGVRQTIDHFEALLAGGYLNIDLA